ncbi:sarcosine oxidase subunit gamma [soil metagenome]
MTADLRRASPLGALADRLPRGERVTLREVADRTLVELRTAAPPPALRLPPGGRWVAEGDQCAVWLGQGWWLLDAPAEGAADLEPPLVGRLRDLCGVSAVEVSAGYAVLELSGTHAPAVLAHACSIDLHPRAFGDGYAARTMLAKAPVVLARTGSAYRIWVRTSYARYLTEGLLDAATEYATPIRAS